MHSVVKLDEGVLETTLISDGGETIARSRWRAAIAPAIAFLQSLGGGTLCVAHRPSDLLP